MRFDFRSNEAATGQHDLKFDFVRDGGATGTRTGRGKSGSGQEEKPSFFLPIVLTFVVIICGGIYYLRASSEVMLAHEGYPTTTVTRQTIVEPKIKIPPPRPYPNPTVKIESPPEKTVDETPTTAVSVTPTTVEVMSTPPVPTTEAIPTTTEEIKLLPVTTVPIPTTTLPPAIEEAEPVTAELLLKDGSSRALAKVVSFEKLSSGTFEAAVHGIPDEIKKDEIGKQFALNIVSSKDGRLITKVSVRDVQRGLKGEKSAILRGSLSGISSAVSGPGAYRIDLLHNGEVLTSSDVTLYRATVVAPPSSDGPRNTVLTAGGSVLPSTGTVNQLPPSESQHPPETIAPVIAAGDDNDLRSRFHQTLSGGTPPQEVPPTPQVSPTTTEPSYVEQPTHQGLPGFHETFSGTFEYSSEFNHDERRPMILELESNGESITGSANIDGFGSFSVQGRILTRGIELNLFGTSMSLRLTGVRREKILRGTYSVSGQKRSGAWQVTLIRS